LAEPRLNVCFHGIGSPGPDVPDADAAYWVSRSAFLALLDDLATWPRTSLSFDDGCASDLEIALPALQERGLTATFFVLAGRLDRPGSLASDGVRALVAHGMSIGTHGWDHVPWRQLDPATRHRELVEARERIEEVSARRVDEAALPLGRYDRSTLRQLRDVGYRHVFTSDRRAASEGAWLQPRFSVHAGDAPAAFREAVSAARRPAARAVASAKGLVKRIR
jgi:peptidoglycan/xylan/chitin deacetylase (PgdA/CDA1 family)